MAVTYRPGATFTTTIGEAKFHLRQPSCAQSMDLAQKLDNLKTGTGPSAVVGFCDLVRDWIVGLDMEGVVFSRDKIEDILSMPEVMRILLILIAGGMTRDDMGK